MRKIISLFPKDGDQTSSRDGNVSSVDVIFSSDGLATTCVIGKRNVSSEAEVNSSWLSNDSCTCFDKKCVSQMELNVSYLWPSGNEI
jgi:hypothetical protein